MVRRQTIPRDGGGISAQRILPTLSSASGQRQLLRDARDQHLPQGQPADAGSAAAKGRVFVRLSLGRLFGSGPGHETVAGEF